MQAMEKVVLNGASVLRWEKHGEVFHVSVVLRIAVDGYFLWTSVYSLLCYHLGNLLFDASAQLVKAALC
jgi:hypothetical protein